uniref:Uncharacterized protein n=1 Tax=Ditylenchus dipsaci TaxID=166011 RepID=A0A915EQ37_9BILA
MKDEQGESRRRTSQAVECQNGIKTMPTNILSSLLLKRDRDSSAAAMQCGSKAWKRWRRIYQASCRNFSTPESSLRKEHKQTVDSIHQKRNDEDKAIAAELAFGYHVAKHNFSLRSTDCSSMLIPTLFSDQSAQRFASARTKTTALIKGVIHPHLKKMMIEETATEGGYFSLGLDATNHEETKLYAVVIRYLTKNWVEESSAGYCVNDERKGSQYGPADQSNLGEEWPRYSEDGFIHRGQHQLKFRRSC